MSGLVATAVAIGGYLAFKGIEKAIIEPVMHHLTVAGFKRFLVPVWDKIDEQLMLPGEMDAFAHLGKEWVYRRVIPQEAKETLNAEVLDQMTTYILKEFNVYKHLEKTQYKGERISTL